MQFTKGDYLAYAYGVPFGAFCIIFGFITIIHKRVNWFLLRTIIGANWDLGKNEKSSSSSSNNPGKVQSNNVTSANIAKGIQQNQSENIEIIDEKNAINTYLYIDIDENEPEDITALSCFIRFFSDVLASAILAVFVAIIFDALIMSSEQVSIGTKCPNFNAECFGKNGSINVGPFNCSEGQFANFSISSVTVWCVGWVYADKSINDVLDTLGTCGGLLGIISSIVPLVYYLSYYNTNFYLSLTCFILPLIPAGALCFTIWYTLPQGPSQLTLIVFSVVIAMVLIGWCWALYRSYSADESAKKTLQKCGCCRLILGCICCSICSKSHNCCLWKKYKFYPWCFFYRHCMRWCCKSRWNRNWSKRCAEEDRRNIRSNRQFESAPLPTTPVTIEYFRQWPKQPVPIMTTSTKTAW